MSPPNILVKISHPLYPINGHAIRNSHQHKDIGILMSSDLSWSSHISSITTQAYKKLGLLHRSSCSGGSISTKKMLYLSLFQSQPVHCSQVWRPSLLKEIKTIQRCETKFILNNYVSDYRTRLLKLHILPLLILHKLNVMFFFFVFVSNPSNKHPELLHHHRLCLSQWQQH